MRNPPGNSAIRVALALPVLMLAPCKAYKAPPCICPYQEVTITPGELYGYHCYRHEDECGCNGGSCQDAVDTFCATSTSLAYPQYCDDPGMPCEFSSTVAANSGDGQTSVSTNEGLKDALDPGFTPTFERLQSQSITPTLLLTRIITFEAEEKRRLITAKVFMYHIPEHLGEPDDHAHVGTTTWTGASSQSAAT